MQIDRSLYLNIIRPLRVDTGPHDPHDDTIIMCENFTTLYERTTISIGCNTCVSNDSREKGIYEIISEAATRDSDTTNDDCIVHIVSKIFWELLRQKTYRKQYHFLVLVLVVLALLVVLVLGAAGGCGGT